MIKRIDLHTHSSCSDGTLTPRELARCAYEAGLSAIALTDHDNISGIPEFSDECERLGIEGIPGIEISAEYKRQLHIVGLYADGGEFRSTVARLGGARGERNIRMLDRIRRGGFDMTENDLIPEGATINTVGRMHMVKAFVKKGYVKTEAEAFEKYIGDDGEFYVKKFSLTPEDSIALIHRSGGIAIFAHPAQATDTEEELFGLSKRLKAAGIDGMECLYSRYSPEETAMCFRIARELDILPSGGSDFHGENKPDVRLGKVSGGDGYIPYEYLERLKGKRS